MDPQRQRFCKKPEKFYFWRYFKWNILTVEKLTKNYMVSVSYARCHTFGRLVLLSERFIEKSIYAI